MQGPIAAFFVEDHRRLDGLLEQALAPGLDAAKFEEFRAGLLRHIALEEKILFVAARNVRGGEALPMAQKLRAEHGALTSLLVPSPTRELIGEIVSILKPHNEIEEGPGGAYELCDEILRSEADGVLERARAYPAVKLAPHYDGPRACRTAKDALARGARRD